MQKVKDGEVHKVKDNVTREVIGGIKVGAGGCKDKSIHKSCWESVGCCLGEVVQKLHKVKDREVHKVKDLVTR